MQYILEGFLSLKIEDGMSSELKREPTSSFTIQHGDNNGILVTTTGEARSEIESIKNENGGV